MLEKATVAQLRNEHEVGDMRTGELYCTALVDAEVSDRQVKRYFEGK